MNKYKIIIIGSGPAGISTALSLKKFAPELADDLLVLDKAKHPRHKLCGGGVTDFADIILDGLGIESRVTKFPIHKACLYFGEKPVYFERENLFYIIRRNEFDADLAEQARSAGIQIREEEALLNLKHENNQVVLETDKADYAANVVIGADGANSVVRKKLFQQQQSRVSRLMEIIVPATPATPEISKNMAVIDFRFMKDNLQGYAWDFPTLIAGKPHLKIGVFDSNIHNNSRADLKQILLRKLETRGISESEVQLQGHPERWFSPNGVYATNNVLLVGDAAGVEPWLGEGIAMALGYGPVAAQAVKQAFDANDFSFSSYKKQIMQSDVGRLLLRNRLIAKCFYRKQFRPLVSVFGKLLGLYFKIKN